jgi:hypothetical protein
MQKIVISTEGNLDIPESVLLRFCELEDITLEWEIEKVNMGTEMTDKGFDKVTFDIKNYFYTDSTETRGELNKDTIKRDNPNLIQAFEEYIKDCEEKKEIPYVKIIEIPDDVKWYIEDYDGWCESVVEEHRSWS